MKISKDQVKVREVYVVELFKHNHNLTVVEANMLLKNKFGHAMRPTRVYELRNEVLVSVPTSETVDTSVVETTN